jgi:hypothetical protein
VPSADKLDPALLQFLLPCSYYMKAILSKGFRCCGSQPVAVRCRLCGVADMHQTPAFHIASERKIPLHYKFDFVSKGATSFH